MRYVSDVIGDQYLEWEKDPAKPVLISSPTGSGKTSFVLKKLLPHAISQNKCIVYLSNRKMLHEQFSSEVEEELHRLLSVDGELSENQKGYIIPLTYQHCEMCGSFPPPMDPSEAIDKWIKVPRYKPPIVEDDSYYKIPVWGMIPRACDPSTWGFRDSPPLDILRIPKNRKVFLDTEKILYYVFDEAHYFLSDSIFNTSCISGLIVLTKYLTDRSISILP